MSSHLMRGTKWGVGITVRATPTAWVMGKRSSERHYLSVVHQRTQLNSFFCFRGLMFGFPGAVIRLFPARIMYSVFVDCLDRKAIWLTSVFFFCILATLHVVLGHGELANLLYHDHKSRALHTWCFMYLFITLSRINVCLNIVFAKQMYFVDIYI